MSAVQEEKPQKHFSNTRRKIPQKKYFWFKVQVKGGLRGGHSGSDIDKGSGNANKLLTRFLYSLTRKKYGMILSEIGGGNLHNAIPREAHAVVGVKKNTKRRYV